MSSLVSDYGDKQLTANSYGSRFGCESCAVWNGEQERMSQCLNACQGVRKNTSSSIRQDQEHGLGILIRAFDTQVDTQGPWNSRQFARYQTVVAARELTKKLRVRREP